MRKALLAALTILASFSAAPLPADETPAMEAFSHGVDELQKASVLTNAVKRQGGWAKAEKRFREAVELKPDYADAYNKLGQSLFNQGKQLEAITEFKHAVAIDPRLTEAWYRLGYSFENLGEDSKVKADEKVRKKLAKTEAARAMEAYRKAIAVTPKNDTESLANAHFRLGVLLRDQAAAAPKAQANFKQAMLNLEKANELITDFPEARNELGRLYDMIGRYPEAIGQYDKAILGHKDYAEAYSNRGVAWWKAGNWDRALEDCRRAIEIDAHFGGGHYNFAEVIFARVQELRLKGLESDRSLIHLEAQKAVDEYRVATELEPDFMPAWYGLAKAYHGYHDFERAGQTYEKILLKDKRQKAAKAALKALKKEQKAYVEHIPKQLRSEEKKAN